MCTVIAVLAKKVVGTEDFEYKRLVQLGSVCSDLREAVDGVVFTDAAITRKCMTPPRPPRGSCDLTRRLTWADLTWESMNAPVLRRLFTVLQYLTKGDRAAAMNSLVLAQPVPTFFPTVLPNLQELHFGQGTIREHQMRVEKLILGLPAYAPQLRCLTMDRLDEAGQVPRALSELQHLEELRIRGIWGELHRKEHGCTPGLEELLSLSSSIRKLHVWNGGRSSTIASSTLQELTLYCHPKLMKVRLRCPELRVFRLETHELDWMSGLLQVVNAILTAKRHSPKLRHLRVTIRSGVYGANGLIARRILMVVDGASLVEEGECTRENWAGHSYVQPYVTLDIALDLVSMDTLSHFKYTELADVIRYTTFNDGDEDDDDDERV